MINYFYIILNVVIFSLLYLLRDKICENLRLIIKPSKNSFHKKKSYLYGGLLLFPSFLIVFYSENFVLNQIQYLNYYLIISFFVLALLDDMIDLSPLSKILFSILILAIIINFDESLRIFYLKSIFFGELLFTNNYLIIYFFPILAIILLINAFNFIDGINGLATLVGLSFLAYIVLKNPILIYSLYLILIAAIFFLFLNFRYSIFLGDSGNYLLSILIASILLKNNYYNPGSYYAEEIFLLLLIPGIDMFRLFIVRIYHGQNPLKGDINHLHHKLFYKFGLNKALIIYLSLVNIPIYLYYFLEKYYFFILFFTLLFYIYLIQSKFLYRYKEKALKKK